MGIEGILGVVTLRELQDDLVKYSLLCRSKTEKIDDGKMDETQEKMENLSLECKALTTKKQEKEKEYQHFRALIEDKEKIIHQMTGSGMQNVKELEEQKAMTQRKKDEIERVLGGIIKDNIALALTGKKIRSSLEIILKSENKLIDWESSKKHTKDKLDKLIELFDQTDGIEPPLTESQIEYLKNKLISIWDNMWFPPPVDCASKVRHTYLNEKERSHVIDRLQNIEKVGVKEVNDLLQQNQYCSNEIDLIESRVNKLTGVDESLQIVAAQMESLRSSERSLYIEIADLTRSITAQESTLNDHTSTLHNMRSRQLSSEPNNKRANLANKVHEIIAEAIDDLYPKYVQKLATEMTIIYKKLAHKTVVKKIEINSDCVVRLLGSKDRDLRTSMDSSAGEDQIFALSLIAAIAKVSEARIPIVMDTPLARLDKEHRMNVLQYLSSCPSEQVILLSQPEEVDQEYKEAIESHICRTYTVSFEELLNGVGVAKVNDGYF
jgi:DNA sulfur modification protein DndD